MCRESATGIVGAAVEVAVSAVTEDEGAAGGAVCARQAFRLL